MHKQIIDNIDRNDIDRLLVITTMISENRKKMQELEKEAKTKILAFLKERKWDKYKDTFTDISVSISKISQETFDKNKLKMFLTQAEYDEACNITSYEKLLVLTKKDRERLKNYVR